MTAPSSYKWQKAIWSAVILTVVVWWFIYTNQHTSDKMGTFDFFVVGWICTVVLTLVVIVCRLFRLCKRDSFVYIFLFLANTLLTFAGFQYGIGDWPRNWFPVFVYFLPGALAVFMLVDIFVSEIPGFKKKT